ncbi:hypothetical protein B4113_2792 [Geobacillus sp. B4113_201601]|nr:hypothetical protein B4113_2792 [Geobacillus sp. B4113_201601]
MICFLFFLGSIKSSPAFDGEPDDGEGMNCFIFVKIIVDNYE